MLRDQANQAEFPRDFLGISLADQPNKYYFIIMSQRIVLEADSSIQLIMEKIQSYKSKVALYFEGFQCQICYFRLRVGKVVPTHSENVRGIVMEDVKDDLNMQSLMLLLKCLKIMGNATFLSTENQNHLLGFNKSMGSHGFRLSFTELMISVIKILSDLQLHTVRNKKHPRPHCLNGVNRESISGADCKANKEVMTVSLDTCSTTCFSDRLLNDTKVGVSIKCNVNK